MARVPQKDVKEMPSNQKLNGINAKHEFPVRLDLQPGKVSANSLFFSFDIVSSNFLLIFCLEVTLSFPILEISRHQSKHGRPFLIVYAKISVLEYEKNPNLAILG